MNLDNNSQRAVVRPALPSRARRGRHPNAEAHGFAERRATTLIELIISIILIGMVILGIFGMDLFSRQQFLGTDKSAQMQNEAVYVLSHISKYLRMAIGDVSNPPVTITPSFINVTIDSYHDGIRNLTNDDTVSYKYESTKFKISFSPRINAPYEILATHVKSFYTTSCDGSPAGNCVSINIETRWNPSKNSGLDNPAFNMNNSVSMPSVSLQ